MHYSRHRLTASMTTSLRSRTCQPMTSGLALLVHWSVQQKLNRFSSVQLRRSVRTLGSTKLFSSSSGLKTVVAIIFCAFIDANKKNQIWRETSDNRRMVIDRRASSLHWVYWVLSDCYRSRTGFLAIRQIRWTKIARPTYTQDALRSWSSWFATQPMVDKTYYNLWACTANSQCRLVQYASSSELWIAGSVLLRRTRSFFRLKVRIHSDVTELNWHGDLVIFLTNWLMSSWGIRLRKSLDLWLWRRQWQMVVLTL